MQNPCVFPKRFDLDQQFTINDYHYYTEDVPAVRGELENAKANPDPNSPTFIIYEPDFCGAKFSCSAPIGLSCNYQDGEKTIISFDVETGSVIL